MIAKAHPDTGVSEIKSGLRTVPVESDYSIPVGELRLYDDHGNYIKSVTVQMGKTAAGQAGRHGR